MGERGRFFLGVDFASKPDAAPAVGAAVAADAAAVFGLGSSSSDEENHRSIVSLMAEQTNSTTAS